MKRKKKKSNFILLLPAMAVFFLITAAYIASYRQSAQRNKPEPGPVIPQESGVEILSGSRREETTPNDTNGGETEMMISRRHTEFRQRMAKRRLTGFRRWKRHRKGKFCPRVKIKIFMLRRE